MKVTSGIAEQDETTYNLSQESYLPKTHLAIIIISVAAKSQSNKLAESVSFIMTQVYSERAVFTCELHIHLTSWQAFWASGKPTDEGLLCSSVGIFHYGSLRWTGGRTSEFRRDDTEERLDVFQHVRIRTSPVLIVLWPRITRPPPPPPVQQQDKRGY